MNSEWLTRPRLTISGWSSYILLVLLTFGYRIGSFRRLGTLHGLSKSVVERSWWQQLFQLVLDAAGYLGW